MANTITMDALARMVQKGFEETAKKDEVNERFTRVDQQLIEIRTILIQDQQKRIEKLEEKVEVLRDLLAVK